MYIYTASIYFIYSMESHLNVSDHHNLIMSNEDYSWVIISFILGALEIYGFIDMAKSCSTDEQEEFIEFVAETFIFGRLPKGFLIAFRIFTMST